MPLTVRAWPDSTDPRTSSFSHIGYAWGMVPPNKFRLSTTEAEFPFDDLNDGVLLTLFDESPPVTTYADASFTYLLQKTGFADLQPTPEDHSVHWFLNLTRTPIFPYQGNLYKLFPDAITMFAIPVERVPPNGDRIPNPVTITPQNHLVTS